MVVSYQDWADALWDLLVVGLLPEKLRPVADFSGYYSP
jgi:hypothetical protein